MLVTLIYIYVSVTEHLSQIHEWQKENLSVCLISQALCHEDIWGNADIAPPFLTSALGGGEWPASRPFRFNAGERFSVTHWIGGWVGPTVWTQWRRKNSCTDRNRTRAVQAVASRYTDWTMPHHHEWQYQTENLRKSLLTRTYYFHQHQEVGTKLSGESCLRLLYIIYLQRVGYSQNRFLSVSVDHFHLKAPCSEQPQASSKSLCDGR
jgi:hypothetical protein